MGNLDPIRREALGWFRLLKAFVELKSKPKRDLNQYTEHLWLADIPIADGCFVLVRDGDEESDPDHWITVEKRLEPTCPEPPEICEQWLNETYPFASNAEPRLQERISVTEEESDIEERIDLESPGDSNDDPESQSTLEQSTTTQLFLEEHPAVVEAWNKYIEEQYRQWAPKHQKWMEHHRVYASLFRIHRTLIRGGEEFELFVGIGLLTWDHPGLGRIRRHMLALPAALEFDAVDGSFSVGPVTTGVGQLVAEMDMLPTDQRPPQFAEQVKRKSNELNDDPWNASSLRVLLSSAANQLVTTGHQVGYYEDSLSPLSTVGSTPVVTLAPALILRPRSQNKPLERIEDVIRQVEQGVNLPKNIRLLGGEQGNGNSGVPDQESRDSGSSAQSRRILFPLPANQEQFQIVIKLKKQDGLLVQGPPGTGKSHTIANLICDQIAQGKRVLVTAQTERALKVLRDKLPKEIQPLCLSLLGSDRASLEQLSESVETILHRTDNRSSDQDTRIKRLTNDIESGIRRRAELDGLLKQIRAAQTQSVMIEGGQYKGTAQTIAQKLSQDRLELGWFRDTVAIDVECTFTIEDWAKVRSGFLDYPDEQRNELAMLFPDKKSLLEPDEFRQLLEQLNSKVMDKERSSKCISQEYALLQELPPSELRVVQQSVGELIKHIDSVLQRPGAWVRTALQDVLADNDQPWKMLRTVTHERYGAIKELLKAADRREIEIPEVISKTKVQADAEDLLAHMRSGGRLNLANRVINKTIRRGWYLTQKVFVDGRPGDNEKTLQELVETLEAEKAIKQIWDYWKEHVQPKTGPLRMQVAQLRELDEDLLDILKTDELVRRVKATVQGVGEVPQPVWYEIDSVRRYLATCLALRDEYDLHDISAKIHQLSHVLADLAAKTNAHPIISDLRAAIENQDLDLYRVAHELYQSKLLAVKNIHDLKTIEGHLRIKCPMLLERIHVESSEEVWKTRLSNVVKAWNWARGNSWFEQYRRENEDQAISKEYQLLDAEIMTQIGQLAALQAWSHCNPSVDEKRSLNAWAEANSNIRRGKGKYVARDRRAAQKNLMACRNAIPAWVLPLYRIYEQIDPQPNMFDVVIVDEASQCSIDSIYLLYLAKKIIVVGDDKQISPQPFVNRHEFDELLKKHMPENTWASVLTPSSSLYAIAKIWFEAPIMLREHFRCMPEIIAFSNDLCYRRQLIPLTQYPPDRLEPIMRVEVRDGYVQGSGQGKTNPPEIDRLVDTVLSCSDDPRYEDMTFGVISLLGDRQAKAIETRLFEVDPEVFEKRHLVCGNAYSFQGDERDVIFLTMVAARGDEQGNTQRNPAQVRREIQQRYNVAASRAKQQLWLFHSVSIEDVPHPECLRHLLIRHFMDPSGDHRLIGDINEAHLAALAHTSDRMAEKPPEPFGSWFEVDVYLAIRERGFDVIPQFDVASYRIDLVVHDGQRMLAVECEGDHWHGPEQFDDDLARQRQLERAGWTFWCVRGSDYFYEPDRALHGLWQELERLGIQSMSSVSEEKRSDDSAVTQIEDTQESPSLPRMTDDVARVESSSRTAGPQRYQRWVPRNVPNPSTAPIASIIPAFVEIVEAEGPVLKEHAVKVYRTAAGLKKVGNILWPRFDSTIEIAIRKGLIEQRTEPRRDDEVVQVLWMPGTPKVVLRDRGDRGPNEIPPSELAALMNEIIRTNTLMDDEGLFRNTCEYLGISRLRSSTRELLESVLKRLRAGEWEDDL